MRIGVISTALAWRVDRYRKRIRCALFRLDRTDIKQALESLGALRSPVLLVHSSLSATGLIHGGPESVVDALTEWVSGRTLTMPTFTYCYPDENGNVPVFDVASTPSVVGAITNYFWRRQNVVRSRHPTHSVACAGPASGELCRDHEYARTPCGTDTPFQRLIEVDCSVLMFGVTMDTYTLFHTAEDTAGVPYLYEPEPLTLKVREPGGTVLPVLMRRQDSRIRRRFREMDSWLEQRRLLVRRKLGFGELLFIPHAAAVHARVVKELRRDPLFLVAEAERPQITRRFAL